MPCDAPDPEGWVTLRVEFDDEEHACFVAQGLGGRAEVMEPAALRERVLASAAAVLKRQKANVV